MNTASTSGSGTLLGNTVTNPKSELKAITTQSGKGYDGPSIPPNIPPPAEEVERETEPLVIQVQSRVLVSDPVVAPVSAPMPNPKPSIPKIKSKWLQRAFNGHCSALTTTSSPKKLGDPDKFLIPCEFPGMDECLALADLGASINLMPFSVWKKLSLPELTPTCMTLELADRSISRPIGIAEDVSVKVGVFHFPTDFVVVDFDADLEVSLNLGRSYL
ncbi:reverse transcriptase domain-containing protein [Tanacetum coccineum]